MSETWLVRSRRSLVVPLTALALTLTVGGGVARAGIPIPAPTAAATAATPSLSKITVTGHGYGHGRGMSQYGAYGYAVKYGWRWDNILRKYYGGTFLLRTARAAPTMPVTVRLTARDNLDLAVTVPKGSFTVAGSIAFSAGQVATLRARPDGHIDVYKSTGCHGTPHRINIIAGNQGVIKPSSAPGNDVAKMVSLCVTGYPAYRGSLTLVPRADSTHPTSTVRRTVNTVGLDDYLRGVVPRESIASWGDAGGGRGMNALEVQAVAARTYVLAENRAAYARTCDTTACQVYQGAGLNFTRIEDARTDKAVSSTYGFVMLKGDHSFAYTEFGASSGGYTAGGQFPAVPDTGDAVSTNPYHNWSTVKNLTVLGPRFGVGPLRSATVLTRDTHGADGGRVLTVRLVGTTATKTVTGDDIRLALGLYSNWFVLHTS